MVLFFPKHFLNDNRTVSNRSAAVWLRKVAKCRRSVPGPIADLPIAGKHNRRTYVNHFYGTFVKGPCFKIYLVVVTAYCLFMFCKLRPFYLCVKLCCSPTRSGNRLLSRRTSLKSFKNLSRQYDLFWTEAQTQRLFQGEIH